MKIEVFIVFILLFGSLSLVSAQDDVCYSDSDCDPSYTCENNVCTHPSAFGQAVAAAAQNKTNITQSIKTNIVPKVLDC
ncbi:MAG TPA: hypothetical protein VJJ79_02635, partial [Candidatus Nanoarchaeia archaeon]|nr:hypothetical protein [Candidatus Nanoarchaeia archaeon]